MDENFTLKKPELRKELPEDVIGYLNETYPPRVNGAGLKQKDSVNYITEEQDFLEDSAVIKCVEKYGLQPLGLLWFLRLHMSKDLGWGVDVTGKKRIMLFSNLHILYNIAENDIEEWTNELIECGILKVVNGSNGNTYWTTMQQFYNYEYKSWTRLKNNAAKRKSYQKKNNQENNQNDAYFPPNFEEDVPSNDILEGVDKLFNI